MKIELQKITVRELAEGYEDNSEGGVVGYDGKLDIRPAYQREFIYRDKQRDAVIETVMQKFPLNVMYWAVREDGTFEVIDGQHVDGDFALNGRYFHNLQVDEKERILDYELMVYLCSGTDSEKLEWFKTINIAGEELSPQELRNAVYAGSWVTDAKRYFSRNNPPAYAVGADYITARVNRQEYLETAIKWINSGNVEDYMAVHQHDPNANALWLYFQSVINWVKATFPTHRREMKTVGWGELYNAYHDTPLDSAKLEAEVTTLMQDEDVERKKGIYSYVLDRQEKHLNIRAFSLNQRREAYERQGGICPVCKGHFSFDDMEADHITPWRDGGKTIADNCQMLCREDNRRKGAI